MTKAEWLRSEIEKLGEVYEQFGLDDPECEHGFTPAEDCPNRRCEVKTLRKALTSIITRYKEELLELDSK